MSNLNVVALISGGKDSFFSILHCQANGHNVVALANLHPPQVEGAGQADDLESYMYQTVGHAVIPLYEQALGLPLYRQDIIGGAANQNKSYGVTTETAQDETESLLPLLRKVLAAHPEVNAVSTGAILSDYQRTRVESVALRLGLTPLSYLWQWPSLLPHTPSSLLEDMASVGQDSRIIKVASGGLDDSFLWQNVADRRTIARLMKATGRFGSPGDGAVLGEGGEYETLAISGPVPLWKYDIVVPPEGVHILSGEAGSASVQISQPCVCPKAGTAPAAELPRPPLLEDQFQAMYEALVAHNHEHTDTPSESSKLESPTGGNSETDDFVLLSNLTGAGHTPAEQTRSIMDRIIAQLGGRNQGPDNIAYTVITLRNMGDFAAVNAVYGSYFVSPNPPARATIACGSVLPADALLSISVTASPDPREGLHVQSRSYWAPANIGPYSQAVRFSDNCGSKSMGGAVLIAGQIPLIPATMDLPKHSHPSRTQSFARQAVLALQHLSRISRVMKVRRYSYAIALIACSGTELDGLAAKADTVRRAWNLFHKPPPSTQTEDDDEDFDIWHQKYGAEKTPWLAHSSGTIEDDDEAQIGVPPLVVISVDSLPRQSDVEWIGSCKTVINHDERPPLHLQCLLDAFRDRILLG
ncbi:hypothetical protein M409DRAFT_52985 [Zasmidium cellare ATCC 36951]|uniref:Diphthine--ammonia ligase n=1 Tax=Zasmidium cellare ATCC 36951 TaxID=1080233 RepID=A0A6A6CQQ3_ZASCE|nr:uncharacterized protein M409DRAFT_52985 [Zasmidium cellare ATCC 36951]KAF2169013.1 hypothetical protein M409DRAFT_52985 [Zasmidium cellare ATCC 36951]